jgi:exodeoxyribonuclease VII small subunit
MNASQRTFEDKLARLDEIVRTLDAGQASLEEMLALYEEGMTLSADCRDELAQAEQRITLIQKRTMPSLHTVAGTYDDDDEDDDEDDEDDDEDNEEDDDDNDEEDNEEDEDEDDDEDDDDNEDNEDDDEQ